MVTRVRWRELQSREGEGGLRERRQGIRTPPPPRIISILHRRLLPSLSWVTVLVIVIGWP